MKRFILGEDGKPCIWPIPQDITWTGERYSIKEPLRIYTANEFRDEAELFTEQLSTSYGMKAALVESNPWDISISICSRGPMEHEEYRLDVTDNEVSLEAGSPMGAFYGLQTLLQLITNSPDPSIHGVRIVDKPLKDFRGVSTCLPVKENLASFKRFVDFLGKYKMNRMVLEFDNRMKFQSHPELDTDSPDSMSKAEILELVKYITVRHIEIIPEFNTLSNQPSACPSQPYAYKTYLDCLEEIIQITKPKRVYVRHESLYTGCWCEKCGDKTAAQIYAGAIEKMHHWLADKEIKMILNSERLFIKTGDTKIHHNAITKRNEIIPATYEAVSLIPKDIIAMDETHGGCAEDTGSEQYFLEAGLQQVFGGCAGPIKNLGQRIRKPNVLGAVTASSTDDSSCEAGCLDNSIYEILKLSCLLWWDGYLSDSSSKGYVINDYLERILAQLYPAERDRIHQRVLPSRISRGFEAVSLREFYNAPLYRLSWRQDDYDYSYIPNAKYIPNTVPFSLFEGVLDLRLDYAMCLVGDGWNKGIFGIPVNGRLKSLNFLHSYITDCSQLLGKVVGSYIVHFSDNSSEEIDVRYGMDISYWKACAGGAPSANPAYTGITFYGEPFILYYSEWVNPKPDLEISSVDLIPADDIEDSGIAVFGITAVI